MSGSEPVLGLKTLTQPRASSRQNGLDVGPQFDPQPILSQRRRLRHIFCRLNQPFIAMFACGKKSGDVKKPSFVFSCHTVPKAGSTVVSGCQSTSTKQRRPNLSRQSPRARRIQVPTRAQPVHSLSSPFLNCPRIRCFPLNEQSCLILIKRCR